MRGPLDGIVVLDMTRALAGPHATMMLGDLGARVIKIEQPGTGDESRHWGPPFAAAAPGAPRAAGQQAGPGGAQAHPDSTYFLSCNRNKESVTCDLRSDEGKDLLRRLAARCDVLVENFRPGVLDRLGFSCERLHELNPRLVICSITGFGHDGPEGARPGYDQIVQGEAGLMSVTGMDADHPVKAGLSIADVLAGVNAALGVVTALHERTATGLGRVVRTSLLASIVGAHAFQGTRWTVAREVPVAAGNHHPSIVPYGAFRCADGMIQVAVANEGQWRRFAPVVGIDPADGRFAENQLRVARRAELITEIERALAGGGRAHWLALLARAGVPAGSIRAIDEVYEWDQTRSQGLVISVDHQVLGRIELPGPALRFDGVAPRDHAPPPVLGQHDAAVRAWLDEEAPAAPAG
jgi:crotonobetainyl-CoA:carnitine CoA-transferase CaiB-like acyl-CoA transferase